MILHCNLERNHARGKLPKICKPESGAGRLWSSVRGRLVPKRTPSSEDFRALFTSGKGGDESTNKKEKKSDVPIGRQAYGVAR